jgi:hypothetical protein
LRRLRRLLDLDASLERTHHEINAAQRHGRAADFTVEALMLGLRSRGVAALAERNVRRRITELDDDQALEVASRLQRLNPHIARAWTVEEVARLLHLRETLRL